MSTGQLGIHLGQVEEQIARSLKTDLVGTSELEWKRNAIRTLHPDVKVKPK